MRLATRIAVALGSLTVLGACGNAAAPSTQTARDSEVTGTRPAIQASFQAWAGTADDYQAAAVLEAHANNGDYGQCMRDKGYSFDWMTSIHLVNPIVDDGTWLNGWLAPTHQPLRSEDLIVRAHDVAMDDLRNHVDLTDKENQAGLDCREIYPGRSDDEIARLTRPSNLDELEASWNRAAEPVLTGLGPIDDYFDCLSKYELPGHRGGAPGNAFTAVDDYLAAEAPDVRTIQTATDRDASEAWNRYVADEATFLDADSACRIDAIAKGLPQLSAMQLKFDDENQQAIAQATADWARIRAQAAALGWGPSAPLAGDTHKFLR